MRVPLHARRAAIGAAILAAALVGAPTNTSAIEVSSDGSIVAEALLGPVPADTGIVWSAPSGNGRTVFVRTKALLLPGLVFTDRYRVYAVDTLTRQVREVTADGDFEPFAVSTDGRFLLGTREIDDMVHDVVALDTVDRTLHPFTMPEPVTNMRQMSISADGTIVAFTATTGLGDTLSPSRLFLGDIATGAVLEPFTGADGDLFDAYVNADGTLVAVSSYADNLDMPIGARGSDAIVYDRVAATVEHAHVTTDGGVPDDQSTVVGMSTDGQSVFVRSWATNLPGADAIDTDDPNAWSSLQLYRFDRATSEMQRLPITTDASSGSWNPVFAPSGEIAAMVAEGAAAILLIDVDTGDWMPVAAEDGPFTLVNSYRGAAFDESGSLLVFAASTNGDPTAMWGTSVYATGLPEADPTADVYLPPPHPLPPAEAPADDVVPTPPPVAAPPPTTAAPSSTPSSTPSTTPTAPTAPGSTSWGATSCMGALFGEPDPDCFAEYVIGYVARQTVVRAFLRGGDNPEQTAVG